MRVPSSIEEALAQVESYVQHPKTVIVEEGPTHWATFKKVVSDAQVFGPSTTDAHLATLAIEHGVVLCSHDEGFRRFVGLKFENPLARRGD
jgi:predicted nucleic acid-binding protein